MYVFVEYKVVAIMMPSALVSLQGVLTASKRLSSSQQAPKQAPSNGFSNIVHDYEKESLELLSWRFVLSDSTKVK